MTERDALLRAVCENPDDDTPRLVFADWLQENGNESDRARAEFIRIHLPLADRERFYDWSMSDDGAKRARELEKEHGERWLADVPKIEGIHWKMWRGFPGWVHAEGWAPLRKLIPKVVGQWPVEHLTLNNLSRRGADRLAADPFLGRIRFLRLHWFESMPTLVALLNSPYMRTVRHLCLRHADIMDAGAWHVANCPNLTGLKYLNLACCGIGDAGVRAMIRSPYLKTIEQIDFERNVHSEELDAELRQVFGTRIDG
jgi:uncharacterized protein (TIGR02996 family)